MESLESLTKKFEQIGYSIKGTYPNRFVYTNEGENTGLLVLNDRLELSRINSTNGVKMCIQYKDITAYFISDVTLVIRDKNTDENTGFFLMFINFEMK